jgi:hypothetical protein
LQVFLVFIFVCMIVMLNLLIAVVGDNYAAVQLTSHSEFLRERARMLVDALNGMEPAESARCAQQMQWVQVVVPNGEVESTGAATEAAKTDSKIGSMESVRTNQHAPHACVFTYPCFEPVQHMQRLMESVHSLDAAAQQERATANKKIGRIEGQIMESQATHAELKHKVDQIFDVLQQLSATIDIVKNATVAADKPAGSNSLTCDL